MLLKKCATMTLNEKVWYSIITLCVVFWCAIAVGTLP